MINDLRARLINGEQANKNEQSSCRFFTMSRLTERRLAGSFASPDADGHWPRNLATRGRAALVVDRRHREYEVSKARSNAIDRSGFGNYMT
jgi:hypothetical protein